MVVAVVASGDEINKIMEEDAENIIGELSKWEAEIMQARNQADRAVELAKQRFGNEITPEVEAYIRAQFSD